MTSRDAFKDAFGESDDDDDDDFAEPFSEKAQKSQGAAYRGKSTPTIMFNSSCDGPSMAFLLQCLRNSSSKIKTLPE